MRVGQNPAKSIEHLPPPARVTVALVTYIPFLSGYYAQSLEVFQACLDSLWRSTPQPFDVLVFDNASCIEARQYLEAQREAGRIQYLVLSDRNVGKGGAWNLIFQGAPGEIIAYADSDVQFLPGWLERSLEVLEAFPGAGMVTARPLRTPEVYHTSTLEWAQRTPGASVEQGQFISWEVFKEHADSLGFSLQQVEELFQTLKDWRIVYQGVTAFSGAAHFQFTVRKETLRPYFPLQMDRPMGQVRLLDERLNENGLLRLCTAEALVRHLGNRLPLDGQDPVGVGPRPARPPSTATRLANLAPVRRSLLWLYHQIFRLYFEGRL
jgi:hypothetical protein